VARAREEEARAFVLRMCPAGRLTYALGGSLRYELPVSDVSLAGVMAAVHAATGELGVLHFGIANATLEEVFCRLIRDVGV